MSIRTKKKQPEADASQTIEKHIAEVQQHAIEAHEMLQEMQQCDLGNVIHAAKITRLGEAHIRRAKGIRGKLKDEIAKIKKGSKLKQNGRHQGPFTCCRRRARQAARMRIP